ncbi:CD276 antigen-like [Clarias gariepinus]|uniref:CD276 antigen-like n=1 Tax=Clarias gariepinus TaxID=13013 RepID=UPI00234D7C99|nr:CD276 antigen-like [Clarias gariepinus]
MDLSVLLLSVLTTCAGFKVNAPAGRVVAVRGQPAVLGCEFPPDSTPDLAPLVVTWQRVEDSRVVHSFYYKVDQLDLQNVDYRDRTSLFVSELQKGNASLRIQRVGPRDVGRYLCTVSNSKGTDKVQVQLEYGAFYKEPQLRINANCSGVTLHYETEGFPKPEIGWFGAHGEDLSGHTEFREDTDGPDGPVALYYLKSSYVSPSSPLNVTFTLKNQLLNQNLTRPVRITYDAANDCSGSKTKTITVLSVLCFFLFLCIAALVIKFWIKARKARRDPPPTSNGTANGKHFYKVESNAEA